MTSRDVISKLEAAGWKNVRTKGSHVQMRHPEKGLVVTVPHPEKDLGIGLIRAIEKSTGIKLR